MEKHIILGIPKEHKGGATNHSLNLARQLHKKGKEVVYYSKWWEPEIKKINLQTEQETEVFEEEVFNSEGVFSLQSHTWEFSGILDKLNKKNKLIYTIHAIIPYFLLPSLEKIAFLQGELPKSRISEIIDKFMKPRERSQLSAIGKADVLLTISKLHKKALERLEIKKPIYVFENPSDIDENDSLIIDEAKFKAEKLRSIIFSDKVFLYCGSLYQQKGAKDLFESFREFNKEIPSTLILLGSGEERKPLLFKNGMRREDLKSIIFVPWIDTSTFKGKSKLLQYYFASDALIQPMITPELYSKAVIDAMYLNIPTITCLSPYTIGSSENAENIYSAMKFLEKNPEQVKAIVKSARKKVEQENTWNNYISRLEKILNEL